MDIKICEKLVNTYNSSILNNTDQSLKEAFYNEATKCAEEHDCVKGRKVLLSLIKNHFDKTNKPFPDFIGGPSSLTFHWSDKYQRQIYIFGEYHSSDIDCQKDEDSECIIPVEIFFDDLFKNTNAFIDIFFEFPSYYKQDLYGAETCYLDNDFRLSELFKKFNNCVHYKTRGHDDCRLARAHYFDIRIQSEKVINYDDILWYERIVEDILNAYDSEEEQRKKFLLIYKLIDLVPKFRTILENLNKEGFWRRQIRENKLINKELDKIEYPEIKEKILDFVEKKVVKEAKKDIIYFQTYVPDILNDVSSPYEVLTAYKQINLCIFVPCARISDAYTLARMFKKFNMKELQEKGYEGDTDQPDEARNIIIYAGNAHSELYRKFLEKKLGFEKINQIGNLKKNKYFPVSSQYKNCIDMRNFLPTTIFSDWPPKFSITALIEKLNYGTQTWTTTEKDVINRVIENNIRFKKAYRLKPDYSNPVHRGILISLLSLCKNNLLSPFFPLKKRPRKERRAVERIIKNLRNHFIQEFKNTM